MAKYTPTSTQWYANDHKHSVSVNSSGHWTLWRGIEEIESDFTRPSREFKDGMTYDEQKVIGYQVLREHELTPNKMTGD